MTTLDQRFDSSDLYTRYRVKIKLRDKLCGGIPKNRDLIRTWLQARTGFDDAVTDVQEQDHKEAVEHAEDRSWVTLPRDDKGYYVENRTVKAMLRESASFLGIFKAKLGSKQVVQHGLEVHQCGVDPRSKEAMKIRLQDYEGEGCLEAALQVMTAQGPRSCLKRQDYVERPTLQFEIWVFTDPPQAKRAISEAELVQILKHAQENGLGASRSQQFGKFDVIEFVKL